MGATPGIQASSAPRLAYPPNGDRTKKMLSAPPIRQQGEEGCGQGLGWPHKPDEATF